MEYILKNGTAVIIRQPKIEDAEQLITLINTADTESLFLARNPGEFQVSVEKEQSIIQDVLDASDRTWFVAEYEGKVVGQCSVGLVQRYKRYRHRADEAFVLLKDYWNLGIGGKMMEECLKWCERNNVKQVELDVVANNERAINMYQRFGFTKVGTIPNALCYENGTFADEYLMIKTM